MGFRNSVYIGESGEGAVEFPSNIQQKIDYDIRTDGQPVYIGFAPKGATADDNVWLMQKFTYNGSNFMILRQSSTGSYTNRASLTYS